VSALPFLFGQVPGGRLARRSTLGLGKIFKKKKLGVRKITSKGVSKITYQLG
jgi:hypothetical protein